MPQDVMVRSEMVSIRRFIESLSEMVPIRRKWVAGLLSYPPPSCYTFSRLIANRQAHRRWNLRNSRNQASNSICSSFSFFQNHSR